MKLVFASNNSNKIKEIQEMLPSDIEIVSLKDIGCHEEIPETADTIEGNAILKADYVTKNYNLPCFADDTGLEIEALNNEPGVYSARYAGESKNADNNMNLVLQKLEHKSNRNARFKTVIALNIAGKQHLFTGVVSGIITKNKLGEKGFGYDPIFQPNGYFETFAQINPQEKAKISHRGLAVEQLIAFLKSK